STTEVSGIEATVREGAETRTFARRPVSFVGFASMPAAMQMMMMRYWQYHHSPAHLPIMRASDQAPPLDIKLEGHEAFQINETMVRVTRYTVAKLRFGRD